MQFFKSILFILFFIIQLALGAAPILPELDATGVKDKLNEMMKDHAKYKKMTPALVRRALKEFVNELDPTKTYFIQSEVEAFINPSDAFVDQVLEEYNKGQYPAFEAMFNKMNAVIARRNSIEAAIKEQTLPKDVKVAEFKDMEWAPSVEALQERLLRLKALQLETAAKLNEETQEKTLQRILKRRMKREDEFTSSNSEDKQKFVYALILKATAASLDSHTAYFTPAEAEQFLIQVQQRLFGLGVQIRDDLNGFTVVKIIEGGPAADGKMLKVNDKIVAVNGEPVVGLDVIEVVEQIRGESSTPVDLTVLREIDENGQKREEKLDFTLKRGEVILKETRMELSFDPYGDGVIGHIKLFSFYQDPQNSSALDIAHAISDLKKKYKLKGIILDLRNNSGGILPQAVAVTGLFISKGVVVSVKNSDNTIQRLRDLDGKNIWKGPLIVLTNRSSASAAEIVAQTLQDYGRALLVGDDHTFGKGSFQTFTLDTTGHTKINPQGEYKVTRGQYYTVSGKSPQLVGATADLVVPGIFSQIDVGEKFTTYPLENDSIEPQFADDLADMPALQHEQIAWLYRSKIQEKLTTYNKYLDILKSNSEIRIQDNKPYQKFLTELKKSSIDPEVLEIYEGEDFQYAETLNIMKDLVILLPASNS